MLVHDLVWTLADVRDYDDDDDDNLKRITSLR